MEKMVAANNKFILNSMKQFKNIISYDISHDYLQKAKKPCRCSNIT